MGKSFTVILVLLVGLTHRVFLAPAIPPNIIRQLQEKTTTNVILSMSQTTTNTLDRLKHQHFISRADRLNAVAKTLKEFAAASQKNVVEFLEREQHMNAKSFSYRVLWITNQIIIRGADKDLLEKLVFLQDVASIGEEIFIKLEDTLETKVFDRFDRDLQDHNHEEDDDEMQWGIEQIEAPSVWKENNRGENIVVATVDTGVRGTHEALRNNFVGDYGWFDPTEGTETPNDSQGHGTHVIGSISGSVKNIGVAPGSKWAACKGCDSMFCSQFHLFECGQWIACPTKPDRSDPDCSKAPHVVSNSWGGPSGSAGMWYRSIIEAYHAAGIIPVFSIGNQGPSCGSALSPGDYANVIGVGATAINNTLTEFSSAGPSITGYRLKPDVAAPGADVFSAHHLSDTSYAIKSGTSMACPHAAGVVTLLLSANPELTFAQVTQSLTGGSVPTNPSGRTCSEIPEDQYPNHYVGYGRINARRSINVMNELFK